MEREADRKMDQMDHEHGTDEHRPVEHERTMPDKPMDHESGRAEHERPMDQQPGQTGQKHERRKRKGGQQPGHPENKDMPERKAG